MESVGITARNPSHKRYTDRKRRARVILSREDGEGSPTARKRIVHMRGPSSSARFGMTINTSVVIGESCCIRCLQA